MSEDHGCVVTPEDVLPDGVDVTALGGVAVRKGSVAAFVANARRLEGLDDDSPAHRAIASELRRLVPALRAVGVFDVFEPRSDLVRGIVERA